MFTIPNWMKNLRVKEPEGTRTPDQVSSSLELCILFNDGDPTILSEVIASLVPQVPLKRQATLKALLQGDVLANAQAFIAEVNTLLAPLLKEQSIHVERPIEEPSTTGGQDQSTAWDTGMDDGSFQGKRRTRGYRAVRAAKRQSFES